MTLSQKIIVSLAGTICVVLFLTALADDPLVFWSIMGELALISMVVGIVFGILMVSGLWVMCKIGILHDEDFNIVRHTREYIKKIRASLAQR